MFFSPLNNNINIFILFYCYTKAILIKPISVNKLTKHFLRTKIVH